MTDLVARAVIQAVDRFSGPVGRMAGSLAAFNRAGAAMQGFADRTAVVADRAKRFGHALSGPMALGLGAMIYRTQEFEKKALGARIATIADAIEKNGDRIAVSHQKIAQEGEAIKQAALATSQALGVSPTGLMESAEAAAKMGIELKKAEAVMRTSAMLKMADPEIGFGQASEFLGTLGLQFRAPAGIDEYNDWIKATGDKIATTASATRTSVSRIEEGFRQFSGVFATFGATVDQSSALIGAMTQGGLLDVESGTALKSAALRFVRPTVEGVGALSAMGIDRRNYMDLKGADPMRAANQLKTLFGLYISKTDKQRLRDMMEAAQKDGSGSDPEFIAKIADYVHKRTGNKETYEDTYGKVLNAITTAGGKVDIFKYLGDIAKGVRDGRVNDAQLATIFEGRHIARMKTLFQQWGEAERVLGIIAPLKGEGLDATVKEYKGSSFGRWEMAMASFDRALIRLRESEGITNLIMSFERLAAAVASMPPGAIENIGMAAAALTALGVAGLAIGGIASGAGAIAALTLFLTNLTPLGRAITLAATAAGVLYAKLDGIAAFFNRIAAAASAIGSGRFSDAAGILSGRLTTDGIDRKALDDISAAYRRATTGTPIGPVNRDPDATDANLMPLVRDIAPTAGPQTVDVTGRVQADVTGQATVGIDNRVRIEVEGPGRVIDQQNGSGRATVPLNTGKSMGDIQAP